MPRDGEMRRHARHEPAGIREVSRRFAECQGCENEGGFFVRVGRQAISGKRSRNTHTFLLNDLWSRVRQSLETAGKSRRSCGLIAARVPARSHNERRIRGWRPDVMVDRENELLIRREREVHSGCAGLPFNRNSCASLWPDDRRAEPAEDRFGDIVRDPGVFDWVNPVKFVPFGGAWLRSVRRIALQPRQLV